MLEGLLFCEDGASGFVDKLRNGHFDADQAEKVKAAVGETLEQIRNSELDSTEIWNILEFMYYLCAFAKEHQTQELTNFEYELLMLVETLRES